jgi:preprotein translocase subunit YajC
MAKGVAGTVITIIVVLVAIGGIYYFMFGKSQGTSMTTSQEGYLPLQQSQQGGRRNKKSSKTMTTSGIYLLLAGVLVGYITSKIV